MSFDRRLAIAGSIHLGTKMIIARPVFKKTAQGMFVVDVTRFLLDQAP